MAVSERSRTTPPNNRSMVVARQSGTTGYGRCPIQTKIFNTDCQACFYRGRPLISMGLPGHQGHLAGPGACCSSWLWHRRRPGVQPHNWNIRVCPIGDVLCSGLNDMVRSDHNPRKSIGQWMYTAFGARTGSRFPREIGVQFLLMFARVGLCRSSILDNMMRSSSICVCVSCLSYANRN